MHMIALLQAVTPVIDGIDHDTWKYLGGYCHAFAPHLDLSRAPYVLYGVKYIDLVSLGAFTPSISYYHAPSAA